MALEMQVNMQILISFIASFLWVILWYCVFYSHMLDPRTIKHLYSKEYTLCAQAHTLPTSNPVQHTLLFRYRMPEYDIKIFPSASKKKEILLWYFATNLCRWTFLSNPVLDRQPWTAWVFLFQQLHHVVFQWSHRLTYCSLFLFWSHSDICLSPHLLKAVKVLLDPNDTCFPSAL